MARAAVLDRNVLSPQYLRDVLIRASIFDLYRAAWADRILNEMRNSLVRAGRVPVDQIDRTVCFMRERCPQFMVENYGDLIPVMTNDEKDRHVLAAVVCAGADTIVTSNGKDFPLASCEQYGLDLYDPDDFLVDFPQLREQLLPSSARIRPCRLGRPIPEATCRGVPTWLRATNSLRA